MMPLPFKKIPLLNFIWFIILSFDMLVRRKGRGGRGGRRRTGGGREGEEKRRKGDMCRERLERGGWALIEERY